MRPELKRHAPTNFAEHDADAFGVKIRGTIFFPFFKWRYIPTEQQDT